MLYVIYSAEELLDIYDGRADADRLLSRTETRNTAAAEQQQKLARRTSRISPLNIGVCRRAWEQLTAGARGADDKRQTPAKVRARAKAGFYGSLHVYFIEEGRV